MTTITTEDNHCKELTEEQMALKGLRFIADTRLSSLKDMGGQDLWLFPPAGNRNVDKIEQDYICSLENGRLVTNNIMGFVGYGDTQLTIRSRFSKDEKNDWFMHYMLQKVFAINVFDLKHTTSDDNSLDIAALMLPYFLQKALRQGLYREYTRQIFNDSKIRGAIDIPRHIKENFPFKNGKMAYTTREYVYDNPVTQLVRHTIEYIKTKKASLSAILYSTPETQANVRQIIDATPSYRKGDLHKVMTANLKPKVHPFYSEYRPLQALCLQILQSKRISYGFSSKNLYGLLFDGAWLWEEYLNLTFRKAGFDHPENRTGKGKIFPFKNKDRYSRFPDFMKDGVIADAKYKFLLSSTNEMADDKLSRDDLNQMIAYMHITSSHDGIFVNPLNFRVINPDTGDHYPDTAFCTKVGELCGIGGNIHIIGVSIPQGCSSYIEFAERMKNNEEVLLNKLRQF